MKKMKLLLLNLTVLIPMMVNAEPVEIDGIYYELMTSNEGNLAEVTIHPELLYSGGIVIPASVTYSGVEYSVTSIAHDAFRSCSSLTSITIPNSVTSIGDGAFNNCSELYSMIVEDGNPNYDSRDDCNAIVETASNTLIAGCNQTVIPNSVTSIGRDAFFGCHILSITIPNSVTSIGQTAFWNCYNIKSITIPKSVTTIGDCAFAGCSGLISIMVEDGNLNYDSRDNCNAIVETASNTLIVGCMNTIIPNSVTSIDNGAFSGCQFTSIIIPNSVTSIGHKAFWGCNFLTSITIPNSVTCIGDSAFSICPGLINISIPNSVKSIGNSAFEGCFALTSISIGSGVEVISEKAFGIIPYIADVYCHADIVPNTALNAFESYYIKNATLHVPEGCADAYRAVEPWKYFKFIVEDDETGINDIKVSTVTEPFDVYDLSGRKVLSQVTSLDGLPRGIYIVNDQKVLKK